MRFVTGVDWSGDAGDPSRAVRENLWLVIAACHVEKHRLEETAQCLSTVKQDLGLEDAHVFKHVRSTEKLRAHYFKAICDTPMKFSVLAIQKSDWPREYVDRTSGTERLLEAMGELFGSCEKELVGGQLLVIDAHRGERQFVQKVNMRIRLIQRHRNLPGFKKVAAVPDHRHDAALVQSADMMAGEIRRLDGATPHVCRDQVTMYGVQH